MVLASGTSSDPAKEVTMRLNTLKIAVMIAAAFLLLAPVQSFANEATSPQKVEQLHSALRDLWLGHIFWVRNVVLETKYGDAEAAKAAEGQVVQDAREIADSISPYYGQGASDKLFALLAGHYGAVKEYMTATYSGSDYGA